MAIDYYPLLRRLKIGSYENCVILTFNADLVFFEQVVLPTLRSQGCRNNVVLMDSEQYIDSLTSVGSQLQRLGKTYSLWPVAAKGAFHPKVILQTNEKHGRLIFGSGNLTVRGYSSNWEVFSEIPFERDSEIASIFNDAWSLIEESAKGSSKAVTRQLDQMVKTSGDLLGIVHSKKLPRFLYAAPGQPSLFDQIKSAVGTGKARRIIVVAPFFDENLQAIHDLAATFDAPEIVTIIQSYSASFPGEHATSMKPLSVHEFVPPRTDKSGYLHAKAIVIQMPNADYTIWGSANCSMAALGGKGNYEAVLLSRFNPGEAVEFLGLKPSLNSEQKIDPMGLTVVSVEKTGGKNHLMLTNAEHDGNLIRVSHNQSDEVAKIDVGILLLESNGVEVATISMKRKDAYSFEGKLTCSFENCVLCKLVLSIDNQKIISTPVAIHFLRDLQEATPSRLQVQIQRMVDAIHNSTFDWANGLEQVCELVIKIGRDQNSKKRQDRIGKKTPTKKPDEPSEEQVDGSYEDFVGELTVDQGDQIDQRQYSHLEELVSTLRSQILADVGDQIEEMDDNEDNWLYREEVDRETAEDGTQTPNSELVDPEILEIMHRRVRRAYSSLMRGLQKRFGWISIQGHDIGLDEFWRLDAVNLLILNGCERRNQFPELGPPLSATLVCEEFLPAITIFFGKSRPLHSASTQNCALFQRADLGNAGGHHDACIKTTCLLVIGLYAHLERSHGLDRDRGGLEIEIVRVLAAILRLGLMPDVQELFQLMARSKWLTALGQEELSKAYDVLVPLARSIERCESQFEFSHDGSADLRPGEWVCSGETGVTHVIGVSGSAVEVAVFGNPDLSTVKMDSLDLIRTNIPTRVRKLDFEISEEFSQFLNYSDGDFEEWKAVIVRQLEGGYYPSLSHVCREAKSGLLRELAAKILKKRGAKFERQA